MDNDIKGFSNYTDTTGPGSIPNRSVNTGNPGNQSTFGFTVTPANQGSYLGDMQSHLPYSPLAGQNIVAQPNAQSLLTSGASYGGAVGRSGYSGTGSYPPPQFGYSGKGSYPPPQFGYSGSGSYPPPSFGYSGTGSYPPYQSQPQPAGVSQCYSGTLYADNSTTTYIPYSQGYSGSSVTPLTTGTSSYQPLVAASTQLPISASGNQATGVSRSYPLATQTFGAKGSTPYTGNTAYSPYSEGSSGSSATPRTTGAFPTVATPPVEEQREKVKMLLDKHGMLGYARSIDNEQSYSLVSSVDPDMLLNSGVGKAVADVAGDQYIKVCKDQPQLSPAACFTYICSNVDRTLSDSGLGRCQNIHNVYVPLARTPDYQAVLKATFIGLFFDAIEKGSGSLLCCFLGCGKAGGTGADLATAVYDARREFKEITGKFAPNLTLVGTKTPEDQKVYDDFNKKQNEILELEPELKPEGRNLKRVHLQETVAQAVSIPPAPDLRNLAPQAPATVGSLTGGLGCTRTKTLIPGMLDVVLHPKGGMFGVGEALSKKGVKFDLTNAANQNMQHHGGIARKFVDVFGNRYSAVTAAAIRVTPIGPGGCLPINILHWGLQQEPGANLDGCQIVYNVVAPIRNNYSPEEYNTVFKETCVSLLLNAHKNGGNVVASCFFGCGIFGGNGTLLARALHAAYFDQRIQQILSTMPPIIFAGLDEGPSRNDLKVYNEFINEFERLQGIKPVNAGYSPGATGKGYSTLKPPSAPSASVSRVPAAGIQKTPDLLPFQSLASVSSTRDSPFSRSSGENNSTLFDTSDSLFSDNTWIESARWPKTGGSTASQMGHMSQVYAGRKGGLEDISSQRSFEKDSGNPQVSDPDKSATAAFNKGEKVIDCGICGESKPEKGSQQVKDIQVCSDCSGDYQNEGVSLTEVAKLGEEYTAINYRPLKIKTESRDLPGYPGAGRIVVSIAATVPDRLSDGRILSICNKAHDHYLPNNDVGKELLRLLKILHKEKLIYKIDKSHTLDQWGITFNFHLKTADSGGERSHGYPDTTYPSRALNEIIGLASTHSLEDKLDTSRLLALIQKG